MKNKCILTCMVAGLLGWGVGCVESMDDETTQTTAQDLVKYCEPGKGYDDCKIFNGDELVSWQEWVDKGQPPWRKISEDEAGNTTITIDADELNGGLIPVMKGQGHYKSEEEALDALSSLLGVKISTTKGDVAFGSLIQYGNSVKVVGEGEEQDLSAATTGNFLVDALSDENGDIFIDGKAIEINLDTVHQLPYKGRGNGKPASGGMTTTQQAVRISAGGEEADLNAFKNDWWFYRSIGSEIDNYKRDGTSSYWEFDGFEWGWFYVRAVWKKRFVRADMKLINRYYYREARTNTFDFITKKVASSYSDSITLKEWWAGASLCFGDGCDFPIGTLNGGIDYFNTVCTRGFAGLAEGVDGTASQCNDGL